MTSTINPSAVRRDWHFRTPPKDCRVLAVGGFVLAALVAYFSTVTLGQLWNAFRVPGAMGNVLLVLMVLAGICAIYPIYPALQGIKYAVTAHSSLAMGDFISARVATDDSRQSAWMTYGLSISLIVLVAFAHFLLANDLAVAKTFFYLPLMSETLPLVLEAFATNIYIFLVAEVLVLIFGLVVAIARLAPGRAGRPVRALAILYADVFRGLPAIVTIYLVGFGLPLTGLPVLKDLSRETLAIIALTLTMSAYVSEVYRAGIESIHKSQTSAARSLGLSYPQTLRFVIVPQAVKAMVPPLMNNFIGLQKDTALLAIIGAIDAFNQAKIVAANHFNLSAVTTVAIIFVLITIPQTRFVDKLVERRRLAAGG